MKGKGFTQRYQHQENVKTSLCHIISGLINRLFAFNSKNVQIILKMNVKENVVVKKKHPKTKERF